METPPKELRRRLHRSQETTQYLEAELSELREFTKLESQFMLLEEGCSKLGDERSKLAAEVENLTKSHEEFKTTFSVKCREKKNYLVDLVGQSVGPDITREIASAFDDLSNCLTANGPSGDAAPNRMSTSTKESLRTSKTWDTVQSELSKIRSTLKAPRRLSDSSLVVEKFRKPKTATGRRDAVSQTEADAEVAEIYNTPNLLDLSISTLHGAGDKLPDVPILTSDVGKLEEKLLEMREELHKSTAANTNLKLAIDDKCEEIQELLNLLDETRASCTCKPMFHEIEEPLSASDVNESRRNLSAFLPTILEASFDGSDMNDSSFVPEPNAISDSNLQGPLDTQESPKVTNLQKCNDFLTSELDYCLSEVENKDEQITLLHTLATHAMSSELAESCNQEIESLETLFADSEVLNNYDIKSEVVKRLENALCLIQKYIDLSLSSPKFDFSSELTNDSSTRINESNVNESVAVLADASFPQQLCSAVFNASSNMSSLDASTLHQNPENVKLTRIMNDVRNLKNCSFTVISNFSREIFKGINKLARLEVMMLRLINNSGADSANCTFYKNALLKDIKEKADEFLGLNDSGENYSFAEFNNSSYGRSANISRVPNRLSMPRSVDDSIHFSMLTEDELHIADDSLHLSVLTGDGNRADDGTSVQRHFSVLTDDEKFTSEISAVYLSISGLTSQLQQLGVLKPESEISDQPPFKDSITMKSIALLLKKLKDSLNQSNPQETSIRYDPECTQFISMDVSSLNLDYSAMKVLQPSQIINQKETADENKENVLKNTVNNYNKLIVDSKTRMDELEVAKNAAEIKLSQKLADYRSLAEEIDTLKSELTLKNLEVSEKFTEIERLKDLLRNRDEDLKDSKNEIEFLTEDLGESKLNHAELALAFEALSERFSDLDMKAHASNLQASEMEGLVNDLENRAKEEASEKEKLIDEIQRISEELSKATERNSALESDLNQFHSEKAALELEHLSGLSVAKERISELESAAETMRSNMDALQNGLSVASKDLSDATKRVSELKEELTKGNGEKEALQNQIRELEKGAKVVVLEKEQLLDELQQISGKLSEATERSLALEADLILFHSEKETLENGLKSTSEELEKASKRVAELEQTANANSYGKKAFKIEIDRVSEELTQAQAKIAELEALRTVSSEKLLGAEEKITELELSNNKILSDRETLEKEMVHTTEELLKTSEKLAEQEQTTNSESSEKEALQIELERLSGELSVAKQSISELEFATEKIMTDKEKLQNGLAVASGELLNATKTISELKGLSGELSAAKKRIFDLESTAETTVLDKEQLQKRLSVTSEELSAAIDRIAELESAAKTICDKGKDQNELEITSKELSDATEQISHLKEELMMSQGEKEALRNRQECISEEMADITERVVTLQSSVSSLESEKESIGYEFARASEQLSKAEEKIAELELSLVTCAEGSDKGDLQNELDRISGELSKATELNAQLERELEGKDVHHISYSTKLEKEVNALQELLKKTRNEFCELIKFSSKRLDLLMVSNKHLQVQLAMKTTKNCNIISELMNKLTFAEAEIEELESGLCNTNAQILMKQSHIEKLEAEVSENGKLLSRLQDLENLSSDLASSLELTRDNMKKLVVTSAQRIGVLECSCEAAKVELSIALVEKQNLETKLAETSNKLLVETMDREKLASELSDSMIVLRTLQEAIQKNEETCGAINQDLTERTAENDLLKSQLDESNMNLMNVRKNFEKLISDTKQNIDGLLLSNRSLSMIAAEESNAKNKLMTELTASEAMISQLKEFIESTQSHKPRGSLKEGGLTAPCTPSSRSTRSGSVLDDRSGNSCASLGVEDTSYTHPTVAFERSVFVSDLPLERTICVDNVDPLSMTLTSQGAVDPLSMTLMPEKLITPRKIFDDEDSSDESNFGTPVANKWGNEKSPVGPDEIEKGLRLTAARDQIKGISNDIASLKRELKTLSQTLPRGITESFTQISQIFPSLYDQISQKESRITELDETNRKLCETVLTGSREKESLRDELKKERDAANILKSQLKDLERDNHLLIEERDVSEMQFNNLEKAIEEALRLWYQDDLPISEDTTQELKSLIREVSTVKHLLSDYLNKPKNINFFSEVKSLLTRTEALDRTLVILKTEGLKKCKDLKDECNHIIGDTNSFRAEIHQTIQKMVVAMGNTPLHDPKTDDLEAQLEIYQSRISDLEAQLGEKMVCIEIMQGQLKDQTNDNSSLKSTNSKLTQDIQNAKADNDDLFKKIEELRVANNALSAEISTLQETIDSMTDKLAMHGNLIHSAEELEKCRELINDLEKRLEEKCVQNCKEQLLTLEEIKISMSAENAKLSEELSELKTREKYLSNQMEDLSASNSSLSEKIASLLEANVELEDKLPSTERELAQALKKIKELESASSCAGKSSLEVVHRLSSLVASTVGQPVDLSGNYDNPLELLAHMKEVLRKSNDVLNAVFSHLKADDTSGIDALESLYTQLKDSDIRDVYVCKKKFSTEIHSLEPEMRVEDLVKLSLIDLQTKLVSVIMEKEQVLIQNFQSDYENKLASKAHALNQYEDREKYMKEMIEDMSKENDKLEKMVAELKSDKATKESSDEQEEHDEYAVLTRQIQNLKNDIEVLKEKNLSLEVSSNKALAQHEKSTSHFVQILSNLKLLLEEDKDPDDEAIIQLCQLDVNSNMRFILNDIHSKIDTKRSKDAENQLALVELDKRYKELYNEHKACKNAVSAVEAKLANVGNELETKVQQISALGAEKVHLETELEELKKINILKGGEVAAANEATIVDLNEQLEMSAKYIEQLESRESNVEKIKNELVQKVGDISRERDCLKQAFSKLLSDAKADVSKTMSYVEMITHLAVDLDSRRGDHSKDINVQFDSLKKRYDDVSQEKQVLEASLTKESNEKMILLDKVKTLQETLANPLHDEEICPFKEHCEKYRNENQELHKLLLIESNNTQRLQEKVGSLEERVSFPIHVDDSCPHKNAKAECDTFRSEKQKLEIILLRANEEKDSLLEKIQVLEGKSKPLHDDRSCPYKEKVQQYKKELWIIRTKAEDEKKNFDIMKKNLQEDLAFKSSTIKEHENRNAATINEFKQRLASSTVSYNQVTQKLEEAEERISFLRDMNSQDKKRLEKEIDVLSKEISRLQTAKVFLQSIGVENDKIQEALPELRKKLCEYDNLKTALADAEGKNAELDKECDDMCAEIKLLQSVVGEKCKENEELQEAVEKLRKEFVDIHELTGKYKSLENQLAEKFQREVHLAEELRLKDTQLSDVSRKLADESLAKNQLEHAFKQLESNLESRNQKINQFISQMKNYEVALADKAKLLEELKATVEAEKSKTGAIQGEKLALEEEFSFLQKELASCKSRLGAVPELEAKLEKLFKERDEALRRYQEIESQMPMVQKKIQDYNQQITALNEDRKALIKIREDVEQNWKAQQSVLVDEVTKLKNCITDKSTRIIELESIMASQNDIVSNQAKISELRAEVERLKKELAQQTSHFVRPQTTPIVVRPSPSSNQPARRQDSVDYEDYHKLEKKYTVVKRLAESRHSKITAYKKLLTQHNITIPSNEVSA